MYIIQLSSRLLRSCMGPLLGGIMYENIGWKWTITSPAYIMGAAVRHWIEALSMVKYMHMCITRFNSHPLLQLLLLFIYLMIKKFTTGFKFWGDPNKFLAPNYAKKLGHSTLSIVIPQQNDDGSVSLRRVSRKLSPSSEHLLSKSRTSSNAGNDFKYESDTEVAQKAGRGRLEDTDKFTLTT